MDESIKAGTYQHILKIKGGTCSYDKELEKHILAYYGGLGKREGVERNQLCTTTGKEMSA